MKNRRFRCLHGAHQAMYGAAMRDSRGPGEMNASCTWIAETRPVTVSVDPTSMLVNCTYVDPTSMSMPLHACLLPQQYYKQIDQRLASTLMGTHKHAWNMASALYCSCFTLKPTTLSWICTYIHICIYMMLTSKSQSINLSISWLALHPGLSFVSSSGSKIKKKC